MKQGTIKLLEKAERAIAATCTLLEAGSAEFAAGRGRPVILTQEGRDSAVLIDIALHERLLDELEVLRDVHQAQKDINAGRVTAHVDARARLLGRYP